MLAFATGLFLLAAAASAQEDVQVRGIVEVDAPRPRGDVSVALALYDAPDGGRLLWKSPTFRALAADWRWTFAGVSGPAGPSRVYDLPDVAYAEFQSGNTVFKPRQAFHRAWGSPRGRPIYDPGPGDLGAGTPPASAAPERRRDMTSDGDGIELRDDSRPVLLQPAPRAQASEPPRAAPRPGPARPQPTQQGERRPAGGGDRSLEDLRLSNDLYFQALREYRTGKTALAVAKLEVALKWNPANAEARVTLERIRQETEVAAVPTGAVPSAEAVRAAQDFYFEALRQYANGRLEKAHAALKRAAQTDPTDRGIATALLRLKREMVLVPGGDVVD